MNGKSVSVPMALIISSLCTILGAVGWAALDRLRIEHDTTVTSTTATIEIANIKTQLTTNKADLEKRLDGLENKFDKLREEVLREHMLLIPKPAPPPRIGKERPVN